MKRVLKVHPNDNVIVALEDLEAEEKLEFEGNSYKLIYDVPSKHKFAAKAFEKGDPVYMYGVIVGAATQSIRSGEPITTENIKHETGEVIPVTEDYTWVKPDLSKWRNRTFMGYHRADGRVGTANYWIVAPLVFCENRNLEVIRESILEKLGYQNLSSHIFDIDPLVKAHQRGCSELELEQLEIGKKQYTSAKRLFLNVDGIKFLTHHLGCGGTRSDAQDLCELIAGYISNPNVAGATILGLGCQNAEQTMLEDALKKRGILGVKPVDILQQQNSASEEQFIATSIKKVFIGLSKANKVQRQPTSMSKLVIGLECGGSDGFSGISANPAVGWVSDVINAIGGATILAEFPELNGIEQELIHRCKNDELARKFFSLMEDYASKAKMVGSGFDANPSPGNIKDGLITDAIKSAGAAKKGGSAPISDVLDYTEPVKNQGLNLLCTPGGDVESTTALAGSGANIILFTTGLGTPTGNIISPVIKVSSNSILYQKMNDIIDVDAGPIINGNASIEMIGEEILDYVLKVASGEFGTKAQLLGQDDFIPWKRGISL